VDFGFFGAGKVVSGDDGAGFHADVGGVAILRAEGDWLAIFDNGKAAFAGIWDGAAIGVKNSHVLILAYS